MNHHCAVFKDWTEVLKMNQAARDEIYSTLRGAYDGFVDHGFGNGVERVYDNLRFSLLTAVTPAIHGDSTASLGERFLRFEMFGDGMFDPTDQIYAAVEDLGREDDITQELREATARFLAKAVPSPLPKIPNWAKDRMVRLVQLISVLRAVVDREQYGDRDLLFRPSPEIGTRLAKQLLKLGQMLAVVVDKQDIDKEVYRLVERVALHTAVPYHIDILGAIVHLGGSATSDQVAQLADIPKSTLVRRLDDLQALGAVTLTKGEKDGRGRKPNLWSLNQRLQQLAEAAGLVGIPMRHRSVVENGF
jgi:hypothetical protein